ncbi:hypothetical protein OS493_010541 [Desmophyllum pertusum]|uniref:Uncharacterized protein n=1 Tax=Desmophyllum pertusum TaxID=174260 RepID=A0A9X0DAL4_9CNID|nr:hypothetical protein OS493_010541 [Desmophyllum pertusum]
MAENSVYHIFWLFSFFSMSFNWTAQPTNPTLAIKGQDVSLTWNYSLTADELLKSQTFYGIIWRRLTQSSSSYNEIGLKNYLKLGGNPGDPGTLSYSELQAPHIVVDRNDPATLHIKDVRREDEGTYKIYFFLQLGGNAIVDHEVNLTVLGKF